MGLMSRISRSIRALFGGIIESTENPELILQQTIRDMRDRVPELNNSVAQVMATEKLLSKSKERLESQVVDLDSKIRASVKLSRDDIATAYIGQLQQAQMDLQKTSQQLEHATAPYGREDAVFMALVREGRVARTRAVVDWLDRCAIAISSQQSAVT